MWLRGEKSWLTFFELVDELPQGSHYKAALLENDELAQKVFEQLDGSSPPPPPPPSFSGYSREVEALLDIQDLLRALLAQNAHSKMKPVARPQTAFQKFKKSYVSAGLRSAVSQLLPSKG